MCLETYIYQTQHFIGLYVLSMSLCFRFCVMIHLPIFYKSYTYFILTNRSGVAKMVYHVYVRVYIYKQL